MFTFGIYAIFNKKGVLKLYENSIKITTILTMIAKIKIIVSKDFLDCFLLDIFLS